MTGTRRRLYLATMPVTDDDGHCRRFIVTRPDLKSLHPDDLNAVRAAFGQELLTTEELGSYTVPDWNEDAS
jgi:hypothetical protein